MNETYFGICVTVSIILGVLIFSIGCAALHAELKAYIEANDDRLLVILLGILAGLVLLALSIPAIIYIAVVGPGTDPWLWDNGGWNLFGHAWPLIGIIAVLWAIPLLRFIPEILATASTAVLPSDEARRAAQQNQSAKNNSRNAPPDPFKSRTSNQARKEEAERTELAAELDEAITDLERKKHELKQHRKHRD